MLFRSIDDHLTRSNQPQLLVDFLELVGRTGAIALFLGHLDVGVIDVVVEPRLVDLFAFGLNLQSRTCLGRDNNAMPAIQLTPAQRKEHRALAHHLEPVVMIGQDGLSAAVLRETDAALNAHGLIKVRVLGDDRTARDALFQSLADQLNAAPIQHIGKLLVLWRPQPTKEKTQDEDRKPGPRDFKVLKYSSRGGQRPQVKTVRVLGNQRLTSGGQIKRAKPKQTSVKKRQLG